MTFPKVDDEQRVATFNRGNQFRRAGEFDKAVSLYEQLIRDNDADAEAHWCCALSRFGIEYVEDPTSFEYIPTCHRASYDNFLEDVDYLAAVEHSEGITRKHYQKEAVRISEIQKDILRTSQSEEPFDVFICYKESDEKGQRTVDSTLAQDIYYQLTDAGFRVFFSRITLEDKVGAEYEPYIFAALNSAKVMVVIGTKPEHLNAVWVKNEWSRFLVLMKKDKQKLLIPCYRDMDPYDMPEALSVLQSYDMSKIGFIQDLIRGIKKVANASPIEIKQDNTQEYIASSSSHNVDSLLKRAYILLEDMEFARANELAEMVLNDNPEDSDGYVIKLLAKYSTFTLDSLAKMGVNLEDDLYFARALKYASPASATKLNAVKNECTERYIRKRKRTRRVRLSVISAAIVIGMICLYVFVLQFPIKYSIATNQLNKGKYENAKAMFINLGEYKDSADLVPETIYKHAVELVNTGNVDEAKQVLEELANYSDSTDITKEIEYQMAKAYMSAERYEDARVIFKELESYGDSVEQIKEIDYIKANQYLSEDDFQNAYDIFIDLGGYKDSLKNVMNIREVYPEVMGIGDEISFGDYKGNTEWIILKKEGTRLLLLSKYAVEKRQYDATGKNMTWDTCSLANWLNTEYLRMAFGDNEKSKILSVNNDPNNSVFILSKEEIEKYLPTKEDRKATLSDNTECFWWVKTSDSKNAVTYVSDHGDILSIGKYSSQYKNGAVRPAMWIDIQ